MLTLDAFFFLGVPGFSLTGVLVTEVGDLIAGVLKMVGGGSEPTLVGFLTGVTGGIFTFFLDVGIALLVAVSVGGSG